MDYIAATKCTSHCCYAALVFLLRNRTLEENLLLTWCLVPLSQSDTFLFLSYEKLCFLDTEFLALLKTIGPIVWMKEPFPLSLIYHGLELLGTTLGSSIKCMYAPMWLPFGNSRCSEPSSSLPNDQLPD